MSKRMMGYGLSAELATKQRQTYKENIDREQEARLWIEEVLGEELVEGADRSQPLGWDLFHKALKDGITLCKLINVLAPGSVKKISKPSNNIFMMENIEKFLKAIGDYGVATGDKFSTPDLFDGCNMLPVVNALHALGRAAQRKDFDGPVLGPREAIHNPRNFDQETMNKGQTVIGLQAGSNKGASQSGMSFGRARTINEHQTS